MKDAKGGRLAVEGLVKGIIGVLSPQLCTWSGNYMRRGIK